MATRPDSRDAPHLFGLGLQEMLADEITTELRDQRAERDKRSEKSRADGHPQSASKGISYGTIRAMANGTVDTAGVVGVDRDLRVRPFFAQGDTISIREFVVGAFNDEMGLQAVDPLTAQAAAGARVVTPTGMVLNGATDLVQEKPRQQRVGRSGSRRQGQRDSHLAGRFHGVLSIQLLQARYLSAHEQCADRTELLVQIGCTACHIPNLVINRDRRVADVETSYDPNRGIFNSLYAVASLLVSENDDGSGHPTIKVPNRNSFMVRNFYADMKRHDLGPAFYERNFDGTLTTLFMTEPLWGVGTSPPYGHDGRSINLREVILRHGGEAGIAQCFCRANRKPRLRSTSS